MDMKIVKRATCMSTQPVRKKCKIETHEFCIKEDKYILVPNVDFKGGNGRVRVYTCEERPEEKVACKTFDDPDLFEEEKIVYKSLLKEPCVKDVVVSVFEVRDGRVVMQYVETPMRCFPGKSEWNSTYSILKVFKDMVRALDVLCEMKKMVFLDATVHNFGYDSDGHGRVIDLGAFQPLQNNDFHYSRPSYVPPQMWVRNLNSEHKAFCTVDATLYEREELQALGYYACLCDSLGYYFKEKGFPEMRFMMHTTGMYDAMQLHDADVWTKKKRLAHLTLAKKKFEEFLFENKEVEPDLTSFMLKCIKAKKVTDIVCFVREAALHVETNLCQENAGTAKAK